jgi:hypothetical protein
MDLSRDRHRPTERDDTQQVKLLDPAIAVLCKEQETYREQLQDQGFLPLLKA